LLKATKVDGVYDDDPMTNPNAQRHDRLDYTQMVADGLQVMDLTAVTLCMENGLPIVVFDLNQPGHIRAAAMGEPVGTLIDGGQSAAARNGVLPE
jgi:uridylate kinase